MRYFCIILILMFYKSSHANYIKVNKFALCPNSPTTPVNLQISSKTVNKISYISGNFTFGNIHENLQVEVAMFIQRHKNYIKVFAFKERDPCKVMNDYFGQFWYDIERAAHIVQVGFCPLPKGTYVLSNHPLDFQRFTFRSFPVGSLKVMARFLDQKKMVFCGEAFLEHVAD